MAANLAASQLPITILGGGISGLSCAYYLYQFSKEVARQETRQSDQPDHGPRKIVLLESSDHLGGWIRSLRSSDGTIHETGPNSVRPAGEAGKNTLQLVDYLGLANGVIPADKAAATKRNVYVGGQMCSLPSGFWSLLRRQPFLSRRPINIILRDVFNNQKRSGPQEMELDPEGNNRWPGDISVFDFFDRKLGSEVARYLVDPFLRGITASDCRTLSMESNFPNLFAMERRVGSVFKSLFTLRPQVTHDFSDSSLVTKAVLQQWPSYTLDNGLQSLPDRLRDYLYHMTDGQVELYTQSSVRSIDWDAENRIFKLQIESQSGDGTEMIDMDSSHIFSALPATKLADTIKESPSLISMVDALLGIDSVTVGVVNLEYAGKSVVKPDDGFGFLVPSSETSERILGTIFSSCVFPAHDAGRDISRLTVMLGGDWAEEYFGSKSQMDSNKLLTVTVESMRRLLGFQSDPLSATVSIQQDCIPQYRLGHGSRLSVIDGTIKGLDLPLSLIGASFGGQSVNDCIFNARKSVESYLKIEPHIVVGRPHKGQSLK